MPSLDIGNLAVTLPTGDPAGQHIFARQLGCGSTEQGRFRISDYGRAKSQIHAAGGAAVKTGGTLLR